MDFLTILSYVLAIVETGALIFLFMHGTGHKDQRCDQSARFHDCKNVF